MNFGILFQVFPIWPAFLVTHIYDIEVCFILQLCCFEETLHWHDSLIRSCIHAFLISVDLSSF